MNTESELLRHVTELCIHFLTNQKKEGLVNFNSPEDLASELGLDEDKGCNNWSELLGWVEKYLHYSVKTNHPGFVNRMWVGANLPSVLGEIAVAVSNTSSCTFESAPVSTLMEKFMIKEILNLVGFTDGEGQMTTGSSNANMIALLSARNEYLNSAKTEGLFCEQPLKAFVSQDAHYSLEKAANIIGIGTKNLIKIPVTSHGEMDISLLREELDSCRNDSTAPFFVCATAGTTVRGAYDPIPELLDLREEYSFWLHVDGAWGGAVVVSDSLRDLFVPGLDRVDSFTWDFHKMLGTSLMCNIFLINRRTHTLGRVCSGGDDRYIFHDNSTNEVRDLGAVSLQCGRRVDSLKWFLDWKFFGKNGFAKRVEYSLELCKYAEEIVKESHDLTLVHPRVSFNVCFRYKTKNPAAEDDITLKIRERLYKTEHSLVGYAYHNNRPFLRLLLANHELTRGDIDTYFMAIVTAGKSLEREGL